MNSTENKDQNITLEQIPADIRLVDKLYVAGKISRATRKHALEILYPDRHWEQWIALFLLGVGATFARCYSFCYHNSYSLPFLSA